MAKGKKNGNGKAKATNGVHEELLESAWEKGQEASAKPKRKGPTQPTLPTMERQVIEDLDDLLFDRANAERAVERAELQLHDLEGRIQLKLQEHGLDFHVAHDGDIQLTVRLEHKAKWKYESANVTAPKETQRLGADLKKKRKRAAPAGAGASA